MGAISITTVILGFLVLFITKDENYKTFSLLILLTSIWSAINTVLHLSISIESITFLTKLTYYIGTALSSLFYIFCRNLCKKNNKTINNLIYILLVLLLPVYIYSDLIVGNYHVNNNNYSWDHGNLWYFFVVSFCFPAFIGIRMIITKYFDSKIENRNVYKNFIVISVLSFLPSTILSIILPKLGYYSLDWLSVIIIPFWLSLVAYNMLMNDIIVDKQIAKVKIIIYLFLSSIFIVTIATNTINELILSTTLLLISSILSCLIIKLIVNNKRYNDVISELIKNKY